MKDLYDAIISQGYGIGKSIVKVDMFLNHRLETSLLRKIGLAFKNHFNEKNVNIILTVESSGIAVAIATAMAFNDIPVVFAKKNKESELEKLIEKGDNYFSPVYSFTHNKRNIITVKKDYLPKGSNVLIVDDFLANGEACFGLIDIIKQAQCSCAGIGICIEKGFQSGGRKLRNNGYDLKSLAIINSIDEGKLDIIDID